MVIALLLMHRTIGLANEQPSQWQILGWISYGSIGPFGFMVSLFWSFANSNFSLETAKASYGVMVAMAQVGSILGPAAVHHFSKLYMVGILCMLLQQGTMYLYILTYGVTERNAMTAKPKKKQGTGILEGLHPFRKHNYVNGIFAISCLFMVEVTIVDFTMKLLGQEFFAEEYPCEVGMGCYNMVVWLL